MGSVLTTLTLQHSCGASRQTLIAASLAAFEGFGIERGCKGMAAPVTHTAHSGPGREGCSDNPIGPLMAARGCSARPSIGVLLACMICDLTSVLCCALWLTDGLVLQVYQPDLTIVASYGFAYALKNVIVAKHWPKVPTLATTLVPT